MLNWSHGIDLGTFPRKISNKDLFDNKCTDIIA